MNAFMWCLYFLIPMLPWCRTHSKWEGWDGYVGYVCPDCASTPEYQNALEKYFEDHP